MSSNARHPSHDGLRKRPCISTSSSNSRNIAIVRSFRPCRFVDASHALWPCALVAVLALRVRARLGSSSTDEGSHTPRSSTPKEAAQTTRTRVRISPGAPRLLLPLTCADTRAASSVGSRTGPMRRSDCERCEKKVRETHAACGIASRIEN